MSAWKPSAVVIGFLAGFIIPYGILSGMFSAFQYRTAEGHTEMPGWFGPVPIMMLLAMPVIGGFVSAQLAKVQPLLHGALVGALGALAATIISGALTTAILGWCVFVSGGVAGGWIYRKWGRK